MRIKILLGLMILLFISICGAYIVKNLFNLHGKELGHIIFPLFVISEIPVIINYFYSILYRFRVIENSKKSVIRKVKRGFFIYYTPGLIFHSTLFTITLGLVYTHLLLLIEQASYCLIFMLILGFIWTTECLLWIKYWPLYPIEKKFLIVLYFVNWLVIFGLLIGLPFHTKTWSLQWTISVSSFLFIPLIGLIGAELLSIRSRFQNRDSIVENTHKSNL